MDVKNPYIVCGNEVLDISKRKCKSCVASKKRPLSNLEIKSKIQKSREKLKKDADKFLRDLDFEMGKFYLLKDKFFLNELDGKMVLSYINNLISFKQGLVNAWDREIPKEVV